MRTLTALLASLLATIALVGCAGSETVSLESVARAATTTQKSGSSRMAMEMSVQVAGRHMRITADGAFDYRRGRGWMVMDLGRLAALGGTNGAPRMTMLFERGTVWVQVPVELRAQTGGRPWLRTTTRGAGLTTGMQSPDPAQLLDTLRGVSDSVEKRGRTSIRGADTTHYRAEIDLGKAMAAAPARERTQAQAMLKMFGGLDSLPTDLYIDDAGRVRRMRVKYDFDIAGEKLNADLRLDLYAFGARVPFKRPPADQVGDASSLTR